MTLWFFHDLAPLMDPRVDREAHATEGRNVTELTDEPLDALDAGQVYDGRHRRQS